MRIFGMSDRARPWEYLHNGYISAGGESNDGHRLRGIKGTASTHTRIRLNQDEVEWAGPPLDPRGAWHQLLQTGEVVVADQKAADMARVLWSNDVVFTMEEA